MVKEDIIAKPKLFDKDERKLGQWQMSSLPNRMLRHLTIGQPPLYQKV